MRKPIVAGLFYEADVEKLKEEIEKSFTDGPGLPSKERNKKFTAGIAPHAGYSFSGKCAAYLYKEIAESQIPDVYVIIGTDHRHNDNKIRISIEDWETPLGIVNVDKEFGQSLITKEIIIDENAHKQEHSIEVQLPFLQYINKDKKFKILPIIFTTASIEMCRRLVIRLLEPRARKLAFIASSDFTHYGVSYDFLPFTKNIKENITKLDKKFIDYILKLNPEEFLDKVVKTRTTICGMSAIATVTEIAKQMQCKPKLLNYYTSGEISKDYNHCVGYASILF